MSDYNLDHPELSTEQVEYLRANPLEACQRENEALKVQLGTYDQLLQDTKEALNVERGRVAVLRTEADLAVEARNALSGSLNLANSSADRLRQERAEAETRNAELEPQISSSIQPDQNNDELHQLKATLSEAKIKNLDKDIQLENARKELAELKAKTKALQTRSEGLNVQLYEAIADREDLKQQLDIVTENLLNQTPKLEITGDLLTATAEYGTLSSSMAQTPQWPTPEPTLEEQRSSSRSPAFKEGIDSTTPEDHNDDDDNLGLELKLKMANEAKTSAIRRAEEVERRLEDCMDLVNGPLAQKEVIDNLKALAREAKAEADRKEEDLIAAAKERDIIKQVAMLDTVKYKAKIAEQQERVEQIHALFTASEQRKSEVEELLKIANAESASTYQVDELQKLLSTHVQRISELDTLLVNSSKHASEIENRLRAQEEEATVLQESAATAASDHATETALLEDLLQDSRNKEIELRELLLATSTSSAKLEEEIERLKGLVKETEDAKIAVEELLSQPERPVKAPRTSNYESQASQTLWAGSEITDDVDPTSISHPVTTEEPLIAAEKKKPAKPKQKRKPKVKRRRDSQYNPQGNDVTSSSDQNGDDAGEHPSIPDPALAAPEIIPPIEESPEALENRRQKRKPKVKRRRDSQYNPQTEEVTSSSDHTGDDERKHPPISDPALAATAIPSPIEVSLNPPETKPTAERKRKQKPKVAPRRSSIYDPKNDDGTSSSDDEEKTSITEQSTNKKAPSTMAGAHLGELAKADENVESRAAPPILRTGARRTRNLNPTYVGEIVVQGSGLKRKSFEGGGAGGGGGRKEKKAKRARR
jgi:hypothetical protein